MNAHSRAEEVRAARLAAGLTQVQLAQLSGIAQPNIANYESGRRTVSPEVKARLLAATRPRPSTVVARNALQVETIARANGATSIRVFGSVARGEDSSDSDIDFLVRMRVGSTLFELLDMQRSLEDLLGRTVDLVSEGGLKARDQDILEQAVPLSHIPI